MVFPDSEHNPVFQPINFPEFSLRIKPFFFSNSEEFLIGRNFEKRRFGNPWLRDFMYTPPPYTHTLKKSCRQNILLEITMNFCKIHTFNFFSSFSFSINCTNVFFNLNMFRHMINFWHFSRKHSCLE